jgi:hypothetical protein
VELQRAALRPRAANALGERRLKHLERGHRAARAARAARARAAATSAGGRRGASAAATGRREPEGGKSEEHCCHADRAARRVR